MMSSIQGLLQTADSNREKRVSSKAPAKGEQDLLNQHFRVKIIYCGNALSGGQLTISETKAILVNAAFRDTAGAGGLFLSSRYEVEGYAAAYDYMMEIGKNGKLELSEDVIKKLHEKLFEKCDSSQAGQYRAVFAGRLWDGYAPPAPEDIPRLMSHLGDQIRSSRTTLHPIELAAMAHKRLLDIHPFLHGNGRVAGLLMNLILVPAGYAVTAVPPERKDSYRAALSESRKLKDMEPFSKFIAECVIETEQNLYKLLISR